jgi:hypothetical protein
MSSTETQIARRKVYGTQYLTRGGFSNMNGTSVPREAALY